MTDKTDDGIKIILLGDSAVGKTKLLERFLMDKYHPQQSSTFALTLFRYDAELDGKKVAIDFWDTAGQERFNNVHPSYYFNSSCCVLVFDCTRKITYKNLNDWYAELQEHRKNIPVLVVANKIDVDYSVTEKSFAFAEKRKAPFFFASASDGTNVVQVFERAIKEAVKFKSRPPSDFVSDVMSLLSEPKKQ